MAGMKELWAAIDELLGMLEGGGQRASGERIRKAIVAGATVMEILEPIRAELRYLAGQELSPPLRQALAQVASQVDAVLPAS